MVYQSYKLAAEATRQTATPFALGLAQNAESVSSALSKSVKRKRSDADEEASSVAVPTPKKSCEEGDDPVMEVPASGFGDFGAALARIKQVREDESDPEQGQKLLFWGALDFRAANFKFPLANNETGLEYLSDETIKNVKTHLELLVTAAADSISDSCATLLKVMRTVVDNGSTLDLAEVKSLMMRGGVPYLVAALKKCVTGFASLVDCTDEGAKETLHSIELLQEELLKVDADDEETQWLVLIIQQMKYNDCKPNNLTERTVDAYQIIPFAINDCIGLRYGDGASKADATDKQRRASSAGGKRVDYLHIIGNLELGSGENSRRGWHDSDLIAGTKCGIAQIRQIKEDLGKNLTERHSDVLSDMLLKIGTATYQVHDGEMSFRLTFNLGAELYALYQWARVKLPDDLRSTLDMAENFLIAKVQYLIARFYSLASSLR
ncbi:hypothetical protein HK104_005961 [Borealophlyctis nickersoniae]|nr:hypothetical protein HK104_005961 [Borealophlyctis nickersoniae]